MIRILIIDDDLDILETVGALLAAKGFEIYSVDTVEKGLEAIPRLSELDTARCSVSGGQPSWVQNGRNHQEALSGIARVSVQRGQPGIRLQPGWAESGGR